MSWRGHRQALHSKKNTATKRGSRKDEQDFAREDSLCVIQCQISKELLGWGFGICLLSRQQVASSAIGGKTPLEFWSEKAAQDYDLLRVFGCPAYYHIKEDKLDSIAKKWVFVRFKRGIKGYKIWDPKERKFALGKDVTFDEALMLKFTVSQQVEIARTKEVSQKVESDDTSPSLERSVSLEIIPKVTQGVIK